MTKRTLFIYAVIWTLLMCASSMLFKVSAAVIISTAYMWFWLGRLSTNQDWGLDQEIGQPEQSTKIEQWGRSHE